MSAVPGGHAFLEEEEAKGEISKAAETGGGKGGMGTDGVFSPL